jgi:hypothetical protein
MRLLNLALTHIPDLQALFIIHPEKYTSINKNELIIR